MSKIALIVELDVAPARLDEYMPLLQIHRTRCLKDEPGTLRIDILRPQADPTKVLIYVVYRDEAAFIAHANGPLRARHYKEADGMLSGASGKKCTLLD